MRYHKEKDKSYITMTYAIGVSDFKLLRSSSNLLKQSSFYIDKTLFIKDLLIDGTQVLVFPRPRRFGKTLNLSMLKYFFDIHEAQENRSLFDGLNIAQNADAMEYQGKYPVISFTFKDLKGNTHDEFLSAMKKLIYKVYKEHDYLLTSPLLSQLDKNDLKPYFSTECSLELSVIDIQDAFKTLSAMLGKHHNQQVIILLDEYDTPLTEAYVADYYDQTIHVMRNMLGATFKDNSNLFKGIITGVTRVAKESLFSDFNNPGIYDITKIDYSQYFGFTQEEIATICDQKCLKDITDWYNGYRFGKSTIIYNPWSILNYLKNHQQLEPYWINTSSNDLIKKDLTADKFRDVKALLDGKTLNIEVQPFTVMAELKIDSNAFWNLLFMAGYLTLDKKGHFKIPNKEIKYFFERTIINWFNRPQYPNFLMSLLEDFIQGNIMNIQNKLTAVILDTMSFHDVAENRQEALYHGFMLGMSLGLKGRYEVESNRESGYGRYDIAWFPKDPLKDPGVIFEIKIAQNETAQTALEQMDDKKYATALKKHGCKTIKMYGLHFDGKIVTTKMFA